MYIGFYNSSIEKFQKEGDRLIILFNKLRNLYYKVESQNKNDFSTEENEMNNIMTEFYSNNIPHWCSFATSTNLPFENDTKRLQRDSFSIKYSNSPTFAKPKTVGRYILQNRNKSKFLCKKI